MDARRRALFANLSEAERLEALRAIDEEPLPVAEVAPSIIHMGGTVKRRDGTHTVWVNGLALNEKDLPSNVRLEFQGGLGLLVVSTADGVYRLRTGQTLNADEGSVREEYELTQEQVDSIRGELARSAALAREASTRTSQAEPASDSDGPQADAGEEPGQAELVQQMLEVLQTLQEARDITEAVQ